MTSYPTRHATWNGETSLCGLYGGFHNPKVLISPVQGWAQNVTCGQCRKTIRFREEVAKEKS